MRVLSRLLFVLAGAIAGGTIVMYLAMTNLACGYAPNGASCHAHPWELGSDDRFWLVTLPTGIVAILVALAVLAHRRSYRSVGRRDAR